MPTHDWIGFNRPFLAGDELKYIKNAIENEHISGDGGFTIQCEKLLESALDAPRVLLTNSCTSALEMSALLLDISNGDEVIVPSFTFPSTANAFALRGAEIKFCDIRSDTLNINEKEIEALISKKTKAIVVVHYSGVACEMDKILSISKTYGVPIVEDNAHGLFGKYKNRQLGTIAPLATLSFHETKSFSSGEGGALIVNQSKFIERAEIIREKGTDRKNYFKGKIDRYTWKDLGSSYLPSDMLAAFLLAQLEAKERILKSRMQSANYYGDGLRDWADKNGVGLPVTPPDCENPHHLFFLLLPSAEIRTRFLSYLESKKIRALFHYQPLHLSPMGKKQGTKIADCPISERVADTIVRLPLFNEMSQEILNRVIQTIKDFNFHA